MKISNEIKRKEIPSHFLEFLSFIPIFNIKSGISILTFLLLDIALLPLLYPKVNAIYYTIVPILIFIHLWLFRLLFRNPFSIQLESIIFTGVIATIGVFCHFIAAQRLAYYALGIDSPTFYILVSNIYILVICILIFYQVNKYSMNNLYKKRNKNKNIVKYGTIIAIAPAFGYVLAQYVIEESELLMYILLYIIFNSFSLFMAYLGSKFIYKYIFMKRNIHLVHFQKPPKKQRKEFQQKGIEIK